MCVWYVVDPLMLAKADDCGLSIDENCSPYVWPILIVLAKVMPFGESGLAASSVAVSVEGPDRCLLLAYPFLSPS